MQSRRWRFAIVVALFVIVVVGRDLVGKYNLPAPEFDTSQRQPRNVSFLDRKGKRRSLDDFSGQLVLVNVWATWCPPCRDELPALEVLQRALGSSRFSVLPIAVDSGGVDVAVRFYKREGIEALAVYAGAEEAVMKSLAVFALPTTILISTGGVELGRVVGPADWGGKRAVDLLERELFALEGRVHERQRRR